MWSDAPPNPIIVHAQAEAHPELEEELDEEPEEAQMKSIMR